MTIRIATLRLTTAERVMGRLMRSPIHDGDDGDSGGTSSESDDSSGDGQAAGNDDDATELTSEASLDKEFPDIDAPAIDDDDGGDDDSDDGPDGEEGDEGDEDPNVNDKGDDKPVSRNQQRINDLTNQAREAEAEAARLRRVLEESGVSVDNASADPLANLEEPDPSKYDYGETDLDYIKDLAKYDAKMEIAVERTEARLKADTATLEAKWTTNLASSVNKFPDFEEVVVAGAKEGKWKCPPVVAVGIKESDFGPDIAYKLATNPGEAERIANMSALEQAREIGRMERDIFHANAAPKPKPVVPVKKSLAPTPVKRRVNGSGGASTTSADTEDFAAFERMADAKLANKR